MVIPRAHLDLCSRHILVMEYLQGVKLVDGIRNKYRKVAALQGKTLEELEAERTKMVREGKFKAQSVEENRIQSERTRWWLFLHDLVLAPDNNILRFAYNISLLRLVYGPCEYKSTEAPVDLGNLLEVLCKVHANQIFEHGLLHYFLFGTVLRSEFFS